MGLVAGDEILAADFVDTSAGAGDSGKGVKLNADGILDESIVQILTKRNVVQILAGNETFASHLILIDGMVAGRGTPGAITKDELFVKNVGGTDYDLHPISSNDAYDVTKNFVFQSTWKISQIGTRHTFMGFAGDNTFDPTNGGVEISEHVAVFNLGTDFTGSDYYFSISDGSTQNKTTITGLNFLVEAVYRIEFDGTNYTLYVNNVLKATLGTNVPTDTSMEIQWGYFDASSSGAFTIRRNAAFAVNFT